MALKQRYVEEITEGKLYRVRDKNDGRNPYIVWGSALSHEDAHKLKERVTGAEKSRTARLEEMSVALTGTPVTPRGDPHVEAADTARMLTTPPRTSSLVTPSKGLHADPRLAEIQQRAMAAASAPAQQAQQRADNLIALPQHGQPHPNDELPFAPEVPEGPPIEVPEGFEGELDELADGVAELE